MSDDATPRLILPYLAAAQAQKHVTLNEALSVLDGLVQGAAVSRTLASQPADPAEGDLYILPAGVTGADWSAHPTSALVRFEAGAWTRLSAPLGARVFVLDEGVMAVRLGDGWRRLGAHSPGGACTALVVREAEAGLSGAHVDMDLVIPARSIVLGVSTRTVAAVTGAAAYSCGVAGEAGRFGAALGVAVNSENIGIIGPSAVYADTPILLTAEGGDFTGGVVRAALHLMVFDAPAAV